MPDPATLVQLAAAILAAAAGACGVLFAIDDHARTGRLSDLLVPGTAGTVAAAAGIVLVWEVLT